MEKYVNFAMIDSIIQVYFMSLGEYRYEGFSYGENVKIMFFFFILATICVYIILMNLIIAIINNIFAKVTA